MSDTPRTDQNAFVVGPAPDEGFEAVQAFFARKLERENAALKDALEAQANYQRELRMDRDRLDWLLTIEGGFWVWRMNEEWEWQPNSKASRAAIDAAREDES